MTGSRTFARACALCIVLCAAPASQPLEAQSERVRAWTYADTVAIANNGATENCASRFAIELTLSGDVLTMLERDTVGPFANCICDYNFSATMAGLPAGVYRCDVKREYLKRYGYAVDTTVLIGSADFSISAPGTQPAVVETMQSQCNPDGVEPPAAVPGLSAIVAPHPVAGSARLLINAQPGDALTVVITDLAGRRIDALSFTADDAGEARVPLAPDRFPASGVYLCTITGSRSLVLPFVVLRR